MKCITPRKPLLLWLDLTHDRSAETLIGHFRASCDCRLAPSPFAVERLVAQQPDMLCLHFDCPDAAGLGLLLEIKHAAPAIPITMFTLQHSEALAVWALRAQVWEYLVLPLATQEKNRYLHALGQLCALRRDANGQGRRPPVERRPPLPESVRLTAEHRKHQGLEKALQHIDQHFRASIDQKELAQRCGMTPFRFSRLFKESVGVGFMEYILGKRMAHARELLDNSQMPITSIGYESGFKDPSYFARAFKQLIGCTPSDYRQANRRARTTSAQQALQQSMSEVLPAAVETSAREG